MPEVKFCGMTRSGDVLEAARLGADYVGVIFAGGPRTQTAEAARDILRELPSRVGRVGVFGAMEPAQVAAMTSMARLDIVQLHADPDPAMVREVRRVAGTPVWAVLRVRGAEIPDGAKALFDEADAVVLDARSDRALGGTGLTLPWADLAMSLLPLRAGRTLVLAGGLTATNVADAVTALAPDVVDVSSGVESAPGVKDHHLMRAFLSAVGFNPRAA
jgi:phosphoribosylanthranilate isomerase